MLKQIDKYIDKITMYRLTVYVLGALNIIAIFFAFIGNLNYQPSGIIISSITLIISCYVINRVFAYIFDVPTNIESWLITALILTLIIPPFSGAPENLTFLLAAAGLAMASKYLISYKGSHIFNPAAVAVALTAIGPGQAASWWIGTSSMLPFVLIGALLIVRKIHRGQMVTIFIITALVASSFYSLLDNVSIVTNFSQTITTSSLFFLSFIMLTEPLTSPKTKGKRALYAILVGILFSPQFQIFSYHTTPEVALIIGNLFSFLVSPKYKFFPILKDKVRISPDSLDFVFAAPRNFRYLPGQYMEWTLPHSKTDKRGNRRYFTIASSPTETDLIIGVKFYDKGSSYKEAMLALTANSQFMADQLSGDFVMPDDKQEKLVFIAGGIGITPFRSMMKYLTDKNEKRDVFLLYSARTKDDLAYVDIFEQARKKVGAKVYYALTGKNSKVKSPYIINGRINDRVIKNLIPDYKTRTYYISGTESMVKTITEQLASLGIYSHQIKFDYFSGYSS